MIKIFKNTPPKSKFILMKRYENISFQQKYSIKIITDFFQKFPEEKQGRKNFKDKEIQNVKLLIYEKIIKKGTKIKADCVGNIKEKTMPKNITITVSYFKKQTEQRSIFAGALIQDSNNKKSQIKTIHGTNKLNKDQLNFFVNILKYIKSNAIALFDKDSLVSQSGGQTSRVDALQNCFYKLKQKHDYKKLKNLSLFSDAFFPFTDSLEFIKKEKMKIDIFAPMGSQNDNKIEAYVKKNKLNFFKLSDRHFKH